MNRIDALFGRLRSEQRRALMPFLTAGDPDLATTAALVNEVIRRGASLVEIGIPYSDPVADGPVIAASYTRALAHGTRLADILKMIRSLRDETTPTSVADAPLVTMVSYSIVYRHGLEAYVKEAADAGVDGLIVPDLPVEEAEGLARIVSDHDLRLIQLVTPRTPKTRAAKILATTTGFLYYVTVAGITGERSELPADLTENVAWLRTQTDLPLCIGFGISQPEHIRRLAPHADGLIVGSAIVRRLSDSPDRPQAEVVQDVGEFVSELADAL